MPVLRWLSALCIAAVLPGILLAVLLFGDWDLGAQPSWSWLALAVTPLACIALLTTDPARHPAIVRALLLALAVHAAIMFALLALANWTAVGRLSLAIDLLLAVALIHPIQGRAPGVLGKATLAWMAGLFGIGVPLALAQGVIVTRRAEAVAAGRPYCIQHGSPVGGDVYEPVRTLFDLSALKLRATATAGGTADRYYQHHGVLVVRGERLEFYNWSYHQQNFVAETINRKAGRTPSLACGPSTRFARKLPVWTAEPDDFVAELGGRRLAIPWAYRPRMDGTVLRLIAIAPDFGPYDSHAHGRRVSPSDSHVAFRAAEASELDRMFLRKAAIGAAEAVGEEFGLQKTEVYRREPAGATRRPILTLYVMRNAAGTTTRYLECHHGGLFVATRCLYAFFADGLVITLPIADASRWEEVAQELVRRLDAFDGGPPAQRS